MTVLLALLAFGQVPPGPLDAFRANFASIRADVDYTYEFGYADSATAEKGRLWKGQVIGFTVHPHRAVIGRWSYDGTTERYEGRTPEAALQEARKRPGNGEIQPFRTEPFELIYDGERAAFHTIQGESSSKRSNFLVYYPRMREPNGLGGAPFYWWGKCRFPIVIEDEFRDARRERSQSVINGFGTELEIYTKDTPGVGSLEVYYDPSIGYIPRYARVTGPGNARDYGFKELYVLDARPCAAGGFVPFEWYELSYYVEDFRRQYPSYDYRTVVRPSFHLIGVGHYKAMRMVDRKTPVALEKMKGVTKISTKESLVSVSVLPDRMGFDDLETRIRRAPTRQKRAIPAVDIDEVRKFSTPPPSRFGWYAFLGVCFLVPLVAVGLFKLRRRGLFLVLIGLLSICWGCGRAPIAGRPRLTAEVTPSFLIHEPNVGFLNLSISVKNKGDRKIKVIQASAGCTCRMIDQSALPCELNPGSALILSARFRTERSYSPRGFILALSTDQGIVESPVNNVAIPRHNLSPGSVNLGTITEDGNDEPRIFEVVHRQVIEKPKPRSGGSIVVPPQFCVKRQESKQEDVPEKPGLAYLDTTYILSLVDGEHGLKKSMVTLTGDDGKMLSETSVVWQRVPYLSSTPAKIYLGSRPIRAFLRCPDENVELTRILSVPPGIKAVVSSTREVSVIAEGNSPEIIDGSIEIETTAPNRPPLRIPVVRYAPLAHRENKE